LAGAVVVHAVDGAVSAVTGAAENGWGCLNDLIMSEYVSVVRGIWVAFLVQGFIGNNL
jgi:hypothetical protein